MSNVKKAPSSSIAEPAPSDGFRRLPLTFARFVHVVHVPSEQIDYVRADLVPKEQGRSYIATYVVELEVIELLTYLNGSLAQTKYIPMHQVKEYER